MMKAKNVLIALVLIVSTLSVSAQEAYLESTKSQSKAKENWFVSIGIGPNLLIGEQDEDASVLGKRIQWGGEFSVGKWFNPYFGARMQVYGGSLKGFNYIADHGGLYTRSDRTRESDPITPYEDLKRVRTKHTQPWQEFDGFWQEFNAMSASIDLMVNLTTLFRGYHRETPIEVVPYIGLGYQHAFESKTNPIFRGFVGRMGARVSYNLNNKIAIYLEPQANVTDSEFDGYIGSRGIDAYVTTLVGVQMAINKNFSKSADLSLSQDEINELNRRINEYHQEIENQQNALEQQQRRLNELEKNSSQGRKQVINNSSKYFPDYVRFNLNSAVVTMSEQYKIEETAAYLKANPQSNLLLIGYADRLTGNSRYNYNLSCKRAENVANQLKSLGIDSRRLIVQCVGDKEQPYEQNDWNRVVIMVERK